MLKSFFNLDLDWNNKFKEKKSRKIKIINKVVNKKLECLVDISDRELYFLWNIWLYTIL